MHNNRWGPGEVLWPELAGAAGWRQQFRAGADHPARDMSQIVEAIVQQVDNVPWNRRLVEA